VRTQFRFHNKSTLAWGKKYAYGYERGKFISPQEDKDFCDSIGRDYMGFQIHYTRNDYDIKLTYKGVETYATGHHAQWMGYAGVIGKYVSYDKEAMADERPFEKAVDEAGLLRLTTFERTTQHIGNVLPEVLEDKWRELRS
jgi:hypothetical protein